MSHEMLQFIAGERRHGTSENVVSIIEPATGEVSSTTQDAARGATSAGSLINVGQDCTAAARAYVQRPIYDAFVNRVAELMGEIRIGAVDDPKTDMGSLISKAHREKVAGMVERAREAGARIVCGGRIPEGPGAVPITSRP